MSKNANPIERLLNAEAKHRIAMENYLICRGTANELHNDIRDTYRTEVLMCAISKLTWYVEQYSEAYEQFRAAEYTTDDALLHDLHTAERR